MTREAVSVKITEQKKALLLEIKERKLRRGGGKRNEQVSGFHRRPEYQLRAGGTEKKEKKTFPSRSPRQTEPVAINHSA